MKDEQFVTLSIVTITDKHCNKMMSNCFVMVAPLSERAWAPRVSMSEKRYLRERETFLADSHCIASFGRSRGTFGLEDLLMLCLWWSCSVDGDTDINLFGTQQLRRNMSVL